MTEVDDNRLELIITKPTKKLWQLTLHYTNDDERFYEHDSTILLVSENIEVIEKKAREIERVAHGHITVHV